MAKKIQFLIIDPQNDFCDQERGTLAVKGADDDMRRLAALIDRIRHQIAKIHVTLDSHHLIHVAHPTYWKDKDGRNPSPFQLISASDVRDGRWMPSQMNGLQSTRNGFCALDYVTALEENGKYPLCIWPPHCLIGSWGHNVFPPLLDALHNWESEHSATVQFVMKGANCHTEHYSAICADVPDPADPGTNLNIELLQDLNQADDVVLAGEAASHCVARTALDADAYFSDGSFARKLVLLSDATSCINGFDTEYKAFVETLTGKGMRIMSTREYAHEISRIY